MTKQIPKSALLIVCALLLTFACCTNPAFANEFKSKDILVRYSGGGALSTSGSQLFEEAGPYMPGDKLTVTVSIKNESSTSCEISISSPKTAQIDSKPLETVGDILISSGSDVLYNGPLSAQLANLAPFAYLEPNKQADLSFTLTLPLELSNEYALTDGLGQWELCLEEMPITTSTEEPRTTSYPKTGFPIPFAIGLSALLGVIGLLLCILGANHNRRDKNHEKTK